MLFNQHFLFIRYCLQRLLFQVIEIHDCDSVEKFIYSPIHQFETVPNSKKLTSNFSFSHSVFKRLVLQTRKNQGLFGKGLIATFKLSSAASLNFRLS